MTNKTGAKWYRRANRNRKSIRHLLAAVFAALIVWSWHPQSLRGNTVEHISEKSVLLGGRIVRDEQGVAHITGRNDWHVSFLLGYVHAQDRFFQMDVARRRASGRLAELLGNGALASDIEFRTLGLRRAARKTLQALKPSSRQLLRAYAAGVNAYLAKKSPLPPEYSSLEISTARPAAPRSADQWRDRKPG